MLVPARVASDDVIVASSAFPLDASVLGTNCVIDPFDDRFLAKRSLLFCFGFGLFCLFFSSIDRIAKIMSLSSSLVAVFCCFVCLLVLSLAISTLDWSYTPVTTLDMRRKKEQTRKKERKRERERERETIGRLAAAGVGPPIDNTRRRRNGARRPFFTFLSIRFLPSFRFQLAFSHQVLTGLDSVPLAFYRVFTGFLLASLSDSPRATLSWTGFYRLLPSFIRFFSGFPRIELSFSLGSHWAGLHWLFTEFLLGFVGFFIGFSTGYTELDWLLPAFTEFYWILFGFFHGLNSVSLGFYRVWWGSQWAGINSTGFYQVVPSFTGFYWVLLSSQWASPS